MFGSDLMMKSAVQGAVWPAVPSPQSAQMASLLFQLEESQWWPAERIKELQLKQAACLLEHTWHSVPFYRDRLQGAGYAPGKPLTEQQWQQIPLLTREEVQEAGDQLTSNKIPNEHGRTSKVSTSGSTGRPVTVQTTQLAGMLWAVITNRDHLWHRRDYKKKLGAIRKVWGGGAQPPEGGRSENWGPASSNLFHTGKAGVLSIDTPVAQQVEWMLKFAPNYLLTYPTNLQALVEYCEAHDVRFPSIEQFRTMAELLRPDVRDAVRRVFGVPVCDMYSSQEVGYIALQAPDGDHLLAQSEVTFVEVINEDGSPTKPGETGRVVVTPLFNFATPLVRYAIGDYAVVGHSSPCGRGLPVLQQVLGRTRNMMVTRDGRRIWPTFGTTTITDIAPVRQHQFVQLDYDTVEARLVVARPLTEAEETQLREHIQSRLPDGMRLNFAYRDGIARSAGGKYEDFVSMVAG